MAQVGLGANLPEDAIYPLNLGDKNGKPLTGANKYPLRFAKGMTPPAAAFWSVTLYDLDGFPVANPHNRFAISSWMPLRYNSDGSLDFYFQNETPGADKETNCLPTPKGPFGLTMRVYAPKNEALTGEWDPHRSSDDDERQLNQSATALHGRIARANFAVPLGARYQIEKNR